MDLSQLTLTTERLFLRAISEEDIEPVFKNFTKDIATYMGPQPSEDISGVYTFVKSSLTGLKEGTNLQMVILRKETEEFLGCVGLHDLNQDPELGLWLKKEAHGNGYGLEAISSVIQWARASIAFDHLKYPVDQRNAPSKRIPEYFNGKIVNRYKEKNMAGEVLDLLEYWIYESVECELRGYHDV
ncbi:MAG: GNAT family N-acetyltransferase [Clostridia bacterium]|nr:GNAT family N-acetyltransferase [Clostridia bacterium]